MTNEKEKDNLGGNCQEGRLAPLGPEKSVLKPYLYTENIHPSPKITLADQVSGGDEESVGFNPYDTAVLYER